MADLDLARGEVDDLQRWFPHELGLIITNELAERVGDPNLGLHLPDAVPAGMYDLFDYALSRSATIREMLERLPRAYRLLDDPPLVEIGAEGNLAYMRKSYLFDAESTRHLAEEFLAQAVVRTRRYTGMEDWAPREIRFRHPQPASIDEHLRLFRAPIRFNYQANEMWFDRELLDAPLLTAEPYLLRIVDRATEQVLARFPSPTSFLDRARLALAELLRGAAPDLEQIARRLRMSSRTLQRRLRDEGASYQGLLDRVRCDLAAAYLSESKMAIAEVAFRLGYTEQSSFYNAFKRWTGKTPVEFRKQTAPALVSDGA